MYNPRPSDLDTFSEQELRIEGYTHMPTDYYRNTIMEPETISTLRPSFGEYEAMGERHEALTSQIDSLNQAMKMSRQRGAFQALQDQMKAVKRLVKEREQIDAQMSVADLARKKTDDHKIAAGLETSYSEQLGSVGDRIAQLESLMLNFAEQAEGEFDFTRCVRPDGSAYGTRGKCKKGTEGGPAPVREGAVAKVASSEKPARESKVKEENYSWGKLIKASNDFKSSQAILHPEHQSKLHGLKNGEKTSFEDEQRVKWNAERKGDQVHLTTPRGGKPVVIDHSRLGGGEQKTAATPAGKTRRGPVDHDARIAKHLDTFNTAKENYTKVKEALKAHKGRGPQARAKRQILEHLLYTAKEKMQMAEMRAIDAKVAKNKALRKA